MKCKIIDSGTKTAHDNMAFDEQLLLSLSTETIPVLHLYDWQGTCATHGLFVNPEEFLCPVGCSKENLEVAVRPTGGGIIFHHCDFAFSMLVPASHPSYTLNTLQNYAFVNEIVCEVIREFLGNDVAPTLLATEQRASVPSCEKFCMAKPTKYDVMVGKMKVGGAAQRRTKHGFLHQGTISLERPEESFLDAILPAKSPVKDSMMLHTFPLLEHRSKKISLDDARRKIKMLLINLVCSKSLP